MKPWKLKKSFRYELAISPDGQTLAVGKRTVDLWSVETREKLWTATSTKHHFGPTFSPDGTRIAAKGLNGEIVVLDSATGELVRNFQNKKDRQGSDVCFSPCGNFLIDGSWDDILTVREIATGDVVFRNTYRQEMLVRVTHTADWSLFAIEHHPKAGAHGRNVRPCYVTLWRWPFDQATALVPAYKTLFWRSANLSPCGTRLAIAYREGDFRMCVVDLATSTPLWSADITIGVSMDQTAWSPCGRYVFCMQEHYVSVHDATTGTVLGYRSLPKTSRIFFSKDGKRIVYGVWGEGLMEDFDLATLESEPAPPKAK